MEIINNFSDIFLSVWDKGILGVDFFQILIGIGIFFSAGGSAPSVEKNSHANAKANANAKFKLNFVRIAEGAKKVIGPNFH